MWQSDFQYYVALESRAGKPIGDVRLNVDWIPALRWAEFEQSVKNDRMPEKRSAHPVIEPIWSPEGEPPYVRGIIVRGNGDGAESVKFPLTYFSGAVIAASSQLVASGAMVAGQRFDYKVYALADAQGRDRASRGFDVTAVDELHAVDRAELAPLMAEAEANSENGNATSTASARNVTETMPIFIPQHVLDEATELARNVGDVETGGILVGKLCRDSNGTLFLRVTAQIPADHTEATRESLRFTPETWVSVDAAISLRNMGEIPLGWWHNHPFFCRNCSPEQRAVCPFSVPAFSAADRDLHREVFQKPWSIALLLSFLGGERPSYDVFAWNQGQIEAVKFFTLPDRGSNTGGNP